MNGVMSSAAQQAQPAGPAAPVRRTRPRRRNISVFTEVEVDIDPADLEEAGYHHEDDCPSKPTALRAPAVDLRDVIASLHRQAHPSQGTDPYLCREEPCRSLSFSQLVPVIGRQP